MQSKKKKKNNGYFTFSKKVRGAIVFICLEHVKDIRTSVLSFVTGSLPKQEIEPWFLSSRTMINNKYLLDNI